jgi:hypothetical protein
MADNKITLRSYRLAFELERRLHRIDRFRIPLPYGVPLAALGYAAVIAIVLLVLSGLPLIGIVVHVLPWPLRLVVLPGLATRALCHRRADGRPAHEAIVAAVVFALSPKQLVRRASPPTGGDRGARQSGPAPPTRRRAPVATTRASA